MNNNHSLVILGHPILAVKVKGIIAERTAKDVIKLIVKETLEDKMEAVSFMKR